jgi:DNA-directed RNA polymerase specialized sigma24 family protein
MGRGWFAPALIRRLSMIKSIPLNKLFAWHRNVRPVADERVVKCPPANPAPTSARNASSPQVPAVPNPRRALRRSSMAQDRPPLPLEQLEKATACLRAAEREVLVLSARERLTNRQIAARLGMTPKRAERLLARAIYKLAGALERQERKPRLWWWFERK